MNRLSVGPLLVILALLSSCTGRPRNLGLPGAELTEEGKPLLKGMRRLATIDLSAGSPESTAASGLFPVPQKQTYLGLVQELEALKLDGDVRGVFVTLSAASVGLTQAESLGRMLHALEVPVSCHAHSLDNPSAWLFAAGCDQIWLSAAGSVETVGLAAESIYLADLLERVGIRAEFVSAGKFKSFAETFTRSGPSDEAHESLLATLRSLREAWIAGAGTRSNKAPNLAKDLELGPFTPAEALTRGLVDNIGFSDDAVEQLKQSTHTERVQARFGPAARVGSAFPIVDLLRQLAGAGDSLGRGPRVAVVPLVGSISMQPGGAFEAEGITARSTRKVLERLRKDDAVKAVVLRIDSPGGSALASDLIWKEVMALRAVKPVVASVGSMAASGGYYIASASNRILAPRTSIVGSIGVVGGKFALGDALERLGINTVTTPASPEPGAAEHAAYLSVFTPWTPVVRERVQAQIESIYNLFLSRVAEGRSQPVAHFAKSAEGRIWSGVQGKMLGLVDDFGDLSDALRVAKDLGGLPQTASVSLEGGYGGVLESLLGGGAAGEEELRARASELLLQQKLTAARMPKLLHPYLNALNALAQGETVLALCPYVISVE